MNLPTIFHVRFRSFHTCSLSLTYFRPSEHFISVMKTTLPVTVTNIRWVFSLWTRTRSGISTTSMSLSATWQKRPPDSTIVWTLRITLLEDHPVTCGELWCPGGLLPPTASWIPNLRYTGAIVVGPTTGRHPQVPPADPPWSDITVRVMTAKTCSRRNRPRNSKSVIVWKGWEMDTKFGTKHKDISSEICLAAATNTNIPVQLRWLFQIQIYQLS